MSCFLSVCFSSKNHQQHNENSSMYVYAWNFRSAIPEFLWTFVPSGNCMYWNTGMITTKKRIDNFNQVLRENLSPFWKKIARRSTGSVYQKIWKTTTGIFCMVLFLLSDLFLYKWRFRYDNYVSVKPIRINMVWQFYLEEDLQTRPFKFSLGSNISLWTYKLHQMGAFMPELNVP